MSSTEMITMRADLLDKLSELAALHHYRNVPVNADLILYMIEYVKRLEDVVVYSETTIPMLRGAGCVDTADSLDRKLQRSTMSAAILNTHKVIR